LQSTALAGDGVIYLNEARSWNVGTRLIRSSATPPDGNYSISVVMQRDNEPSVAFGIMGRVDDTNGTFHGLLYNQFGPGFAIVNEGGELTTWDGSSFASNDTLTVAIGNGHAFAYKNGVFLSGVHYGSAGAAVGKVGLYFRDNNRIGFKSISAVALAKKLIVDGDSLCGLPALNNFPDLTIGRLGPEWWVVNKAVAGQHLTDMMADQATEILPEFDATRVLNVFLVGGGTNDINAGDTDAAETQANQQAYCEAILAASPAAKIGVLTITPRSDNNPAADTVRLATNTLIRNNYSGYADFLVDLAGDARFADTGGVAYTDGLHYSTTGAGYAAEDVYLAMVGAGIT
jgi:hypothetical protein